MKKRLLTFIPVLLVVFFCSSFSVFAYVGPYAQFGQSWDIISQSGYTPINAYLNLTSFYNTSESNAYPNAIYEQVDTYKVLGEFIIFNNNDEDIKFNGSMPHLAQCYIIPSNNYPSNISVALTDVHYLAGTLNISSVTSNSIFIFENTILAQDGKPNPIIIPAQSSVCCYFELTYTITITGATSTTPSYNPPTFNSSSTHLTGQVHSGVFGQYHENYISYMPDIYNQLVQIYAKEQDIDTHVQQILDAYNQNVSTSNDLDNSSDSLETQLDNVHTQEQQWYSDNETAIQATGLSNYQFSSSQISGLTAIRTQFSDIWEKLGDWTLVYIFTLLLSFATFILRHRPTTKAQQRYKEQSANRSLQREYYISRMYDNNSGQGDLMQVALRKYR